MSDFKEKFLRHLEELAFFLEYRGENPFRIRAYHVGAEILSGLSNEDLKKKIQDKSLTALSGIGKGLLGIAESFLKDETSKEWLDARGDLPASIVELRMVPGLGAKKIRALYESLQIASIGELEYACAENRLVDLPSFGEKTQAKILASLRELKGREGKVILGDALRLAEDFEKSIPKNIKICRVGDLGRCQEIVCGFDYLIAEDDASKIKKLKFLKNIETNGDLIEANSLGIRIRFHLCQPEIFSIRRVFQTSSEEHWKSLESAARHLEFNLNSDGLAKGKRRQKVSSEEVLYKTLELPFFETFERELPATKVKTAEIEVKDLTGVFHLHTTASDGANTLDEMAKAARAHKWAFMGLSDHSKSAYYAKGLPETELKKQWEEIAALNSKFRELKILRGVESDILKDGSLDYTDDFLEGFDFVIASIHSRYGMSDMTERILRAIENPKTTMIGHLTGRLLLAREGYYVDHAKIIEAAIKFKKVIELNSHPNRLDIDWHYLTQACKEGLLISINPDAHSVAGFEDVRFGVWMARKAGVPNTNIVNTWPFEKVAEFLEL